MKRKFTIFILSLILEIVIENCFSIISDVVWKRNINKMASVDPKFLWGNKSLDLAFSLL